MNKLASLPVLRFFLNSKTILALVGKIVLMLVIPYAYLLLCGLVFDWWLKLYSMIFFIFFSFIFFYLVAFFLVGLAIFRFCKKKTL